MVHEPARGHERWHALAQVRPLVDFGRASPAALGDQDAYIPAFNLVIMSQAKRIWANLGTFEQLDLNSDGVLSREEIEIALRHKLKAEPSKMMVDNVMRCVEEEELDGPQDDDPRQRAHKRMRRQLLQQCQLDPDATIGM